MKLAHLDKPHPDLVREIELTKLMSNLSAAQQEVLPYLAMGITQGQTSTFTGVSERKIEDWLFNDEQFCYVLERMREMRTRWAMAQMSAAGYKGIQVLIGYLTMDPFSPVAQKMGERMQIAILQERRRAAQFLVDQLGLKRNRMEVVHRHEGQVDASMHATPETIDMLAKRIVELQKGEDEIEDADYDVLPEGDPKYGERRIDERTGREQCHACGGWYKDIEDHVLSIHPQFNSFQDYLEHYGLVEGDADAEKGPDG